jgi:two-component system chemotaxis response regulator CheB
LAVSEFMAKIRVLIADDSVVIRRLLSDALAQDPEIEVAGTASNGLIALARIEHVNPDLVTLDVEMPVLNGLDTLAALRKTHPRLPVIMFSTLTERGAATTLDALALGANDYVAKPSNTGSVAVSLQLVKEELIPKIKALCRPAGKHPVVSKPIPLGTNQTATGKIAAVAIGVSTGGPNALSVVLPGLARAFPVPILIVQHMPPLFTRLLAERLSAVSERSVREGHSGALVKAAEVWVAPGGYHMEVQRDGGLATLSIHQGPPENSCRPAVDVLFRSMAQTFGGGTLAVVLTGMGQDGLRGCERIREMGGHVLVQDEASSVVWGMPGAVAQAGLADRVLPLPELAAELNRLVGIEPQAIERGRQKEILSPAHSS